MEEKIEAWALLVADYGSSKIVHGSSALATLPSLYDEDDFAFLVEELLEPGDRHELRSSLDRHVLDVINA